MKTLRERVDNLKSMQWYWLEMVQNCDFWLFWFRFVLSSQSDKMQVSDPNNVKIYNLSAGKSLPEVSKRYFSEHDFKALGL